MADEAPLLAHQREDALWDRVEAASPPVKAGSPLPPQASTVHQKLSLRAGTCPCSPPHPACDASLPSCSQAGPTVAALLAEHPADVIRTLQKSGVQKVAEFQVEVRCAFKTPSLSQQLLFDEQRAEPSTIRMGEACSRGQRQAGWGVPAALPHARKRGCRRSASSLLLSPRSPAASTQQDKLVLSKIGDDSIVTMASRLRRRQAQCLPHSTALAATAGQMPLPCAAGLSGGVIMGAHSCPLP